MRETIVDLGGGNDRSFGNLEATNLYPQLEAAIRLVDQRAERGRRPAKIVGGFAGRGESRGANPRPGKVAAEQIFQDRRQPIGERADQGQGEANGAREGEREAAKVEATPDIAIPTAGLFRHAQRGESLREREGGAEGGGERTPQVSVHQAEKREQGRGGGGDGRVENQRANDNEPRRQRRDGEETGEGTEERDQLSEKGSMLAGKGNGGGNDRSGRRFAKRISALVGEEAGESSVQRRTARVGPREDDGEIGSERRANVRQGSVAGAIRASGRSSSILGLERTR